jgi:hypothetical protein
MKNKVISDKQRGTEPLLGEIRDLILQSRIQVAAVVNSTMSKLYWKIGDKIKREILKSRRADYGEKIVQSLSAQLMCEFGNGFSRRNLFNMIRFAEEFRDQANAWILAQHLSWSSN